MALVASESAVEAGWAGRAALDLARSWSGVGERVVLVDGALDEPTLHTDAHVENFEGLSDAALFGVSVGRVARQVDDGAFYLITAGTAVADPNRVAASRRWAALLDGFLEAGVTLLVFLRDGDAGCAAFLGSVSDIVVLSAETGGLPAAVRDLEGMVRAVTGPADSGIPDAAGESWVLEAQAPEAPPADTPAGRRGAKVLALLGEGGMPGPRPPKDWTATGPGDNRRIMGFAGLLVLLLVYLLVVFGIL